MRLSRRRKVCMQRLKSILLWLLFIILLLKLLETLIPLQLVLQQMLFQFHSKLLLLIMLLQPVVPMTKLLYMSTNQKRPMSLLMIISGISILRPSLANTESSWSESNNGFLPFSVVNCNTDSSRVFSNLQNCPIIINYMMDPVSASGALVF